MSFSGGWSNRQWKPSAAPSHSPRLTAWSQLGLCFCRKFNRSFTEESLFTCWCSSHRIDLCAKKLEDQQNVQSILRMVRRLSSHIASSTAAQGHMKAVTKVITEDSEKANRSTSGISYAPQKIVSHAAGGWQDSRWFLLWKNTSQRVQPGPTRRSSSITCPTLLFGRPAF